MSIIAILLVIVAFCVAFWLIRTQISAPFQTIAMIVVGILLILFLLWAAGVLGTLNFRVR